MSKSIILDTETTSIKEPDLIEAAWIEVTSLQPFSIGKEFYKRYHTDKIIDLKATAKHGIVNSDLEGLPSNTEFKLPDDVEYLIGHNIDFDWGVIGSPDIKRICTLALARAVYDDLDSYALQPLIYHLDLKYARSIHGQVHGAKVDCNSCAILLEHIVNLLDIKDMDELYELSEQARIPTKMYFGKYKGMFITDLPDEYVEWLLGKDDLDPYLTKALLFRE